MIQNRARKQHQDRAGEEGGRRPGEPILFNVGQRSPFWLGILKYGFCQYSISNSVAILWYLWLAGIIFNKITTFFQVSGEEIWEEADKKEQVLYLQKIGDLKTKTPTVESLFKIPDTNSWWFQFVFAAWKGFEILLWHLLQVLSSSRPYHNVRFWGGRPSKICLFEWQEDGLSYLWNFQELKKPTGFKHLVNSDIPPMVSVNSCKLVASPWTNVETLLIVALRVTLCVNSTEN